MKQSKQFLSVEQQIEKLKEKGIIINYDIDKITSVLERENYYRIINGYKDIFLDKEKSTPGNDVFIPGTNISDFISLYYFDVFLRSFYLDNILVVENHIKTAIAYEFSKEYGSNHNEYMNPNNFQEKVKCENGYKKYNTLKNNIDNVLKNKWSLKNEPYISHYQKTYTGIPLWVLINSCSFGVTYEIFQFLKDSVKNKIAKHFNMSFSSLDRSISFLCYYRNICAHNNRFFLCKKERKD